ncbi:NAD(P)-binding protein [Hyaloscypha hepaticicola]|uniref:NAD(P)-binding protein n=1 Tax=Hyaloscypha hepaticicola TaxID=2082293 RepID=A0A2J6Q5B1_9HELO|nr:NAD(P)-binding protein [Hyaloscypha hepaticicola]
MSSNILITGAAGYVGGSIIADFLSSSSPVLKRSRITAAVRSDEQAKLLSESGINVLQLDLTDEKAVVESLVKHNINIVVHTASSLDLTLALNLLAGLAEQQKASESNAYFIHTSGLSAFCPETGWPQGVMKDSGPIFETEKQLADSFSLRKTDVTITETAKELGITSFIVVPSTVYGKGKGQWNQLSVIFPIAVQASIKQKSVSKFPVDGNIAGVHISDLTELYGLIVKKILQGSGDSIPNGTHGHYFAIAHEMAWWETLGRLAAAMEARGLVASSETQVWTSNKAAAEATGVPEIFVEIFFNSSANIIVDNAFKLGWKPTWDKARFFENIDDEVVSVLELGKARSSLIDSLFLAAKN